MLCTGMRNVSGLGVVESSIDLGPLSLRSSLRLFARLTPGLCTADEKVKFVNSLLIPKQGDVTLNSRELSPAAAEILNMVGGGHPGKIVKLACESTTEKVNELSQKGEFIIKSFNKSYT